MGASLTEQVQRLTNTLKQREAELTELREREARLRTLIDATPDVLCFKDGEGRWLESNQANLEFLGLSGVEYRGKTNADLAHLTQFHQEALLQCDRTDETAWQTGSAYRVEEVVHFADGRVSTLDMIKVPLFYPDGQRKGLVVLGRDISDRIQAEEALRARESQYRDLVQTANCIILRWGTDGTVHFMNDYGLRLFGFQPTELIGQNVVGTIVPETETSGRDLQTLMVEICEHPENYVFNENENISKQGDRRWIVWANKPVMNDQGQLVEILSVGTDATERKQVQIALETSLALQRATFESIQDGILAVDRTNNIVSYNQKFLEMWSIPPEVLNEPSSPKRIAYLADQVQDSEGFLQRVKALYAAPETVSYDLIALRDGRVFERHSCPQRISDQIIGRVWSFRDITEQKRAEAALRANELKYRNIFENSQVGIGRTRAQDGLFLAANQRCAEIMGYSMPADLVGKHTSLEFYVNPQHRQKMLAEVQLHGEVRNFEVPLRQPNGTLKWCLLSLRLNPEEDCLDFVIADISDRKQLEEELRQSQQFLDSVIENIPLALFAKDVQDDFRYVLINRSSERILGFSRERGLGLKDSDLIASKWADFYRAQDLAVVNRGTLLEIPEQEIVPETEAPFLARILKFPLFNPDGEITHLLCIGEDITERKRTEQALQQRAQMDSLLSSLSRQFIDQEFDIAIEFALQAVARFIGAERSCIFEYTEPSHFLLTHEWCAPTIKPLPPEARGTVLMEFPWLHQQVSSGLNMCVSSLSELPPDAIAEKALFEQLSIRSVMTVPMVHSGQVVGFLGADVVHYTRTWSPEDANLLKRLGELVAIGRARHRVEVALREAKNAAETANRAKSTFLANMSHELRTPLNAILGFAQLMERDRALTARQREFLATINRSGEHLLSLINDVLEMSKIEAGRITLNPCDFDLHRLLQTLQDMFQVRADAKHLDLQFYLDPNLPQYIHTDEGKLRQVLINLLGNAVKFTDQGHVILQVKTQATESQAIEPQGTESPVLVDPPLSLYFTIQDTGPGIDLTDQPRLFQPFVQTPNNTHAPEGTGLGLAISRQFVRLMGGDIRVDSTAGQGATFCFEIQAQRADAADSQQPAPIGRVIAVAPDQPAYRILVVDDRAENRELIRQLLKTVGFSTRVAIHGQDAIAQWQDWQPHLIWMDMRMPVMDGYEATRQIRAIAPPSLKIIALTASAFEEQRAQILAAGCDDLVRKPFRESIIFDKMTEHLGVQYIYETAEDREQAAEMHPHGNGHWVGVPKQSLSPQDLQTMPNDWIVALQQAAIAVDGEQIFTLISQIPESEQAIAIALTTLVKQFDFDAILALSEGVLSSS